MTVEARGLACGAPAAAADAGHARSPPMARPMASSNAALRPRLGRELPLSQGGCWEVASLSYLQWKVIGIARPRGPGGPPGLAAPAPTRRGRG
jgi:hypothetical protein